MSETTDFVTVRVADQLLGLPVLRVHDVFRPQAITRVPRAPAMVAGVMNLRGRIVTAIDLRARLGLPSRDDGVAPMCAVVENRGQPYALVIDSIGDVVSVDASSFEANPATLSPRWRAVAEGVYRLEGELLVAIDVDSLFDLESALAA